jgi:hypothetical protein
MEMNFSNEQMKSPLEEEKEKLGQNSEEVANLVIEKGGQHTEKAKLLLVKIGKVAGAGIAAAGAVGALGSLGLGIAEVIDHTQNFMVDVPPHHALPVITGLSVSGLAALVGGLTMEKFNQIADSIKSKIQQLKSVPV